MVKEVRCSGLYRPMNCLGFLNMVDLPESESNEAARAGTAFGEYTQQRIIHRDAPLMTRASNGVFIDNDMRFFGDEIVEELIAENRTNWMSEQRIDWPTRSGVWIRGQYDFASIKDNCLYIDDLKYGWKIVECSEKHPNWQLLGYAIGEYQRLKYAFDKIILTIRQPRAHHEDGPTRSWTLTPEQLMAYKEKIEQRFDLYVAGDNTLATGNHCQYCAAAAESCPALNRALYASVDYVMTDFNQDALTDKEVADQFNLISRVEEVMKIKKSSLEQLAINRIKLGKIVPGLAIEESFGNREWKRDVNAELIEIMTGKTITERTLLSPAKAEKKGLSKELVSQLTTRFSKGSKLVSKDNSVIGDAIFGNQAPQGKV